MAQPIAPPPPPHRGELRLVREAPPPDVPPLKVGDTCRLISGSPLLTVVREAGAGRSLVVKDKAGTRHVIPRVALRRFRRVV